MLLFWLFLAEAGGDDARAGDVAAGEVDEVALLPVRRGVCVMCNVWCRQAGKQGEALLGSVSQRVPSLQAGRIDVTRATPSMRCRASLQRRIDSALGTEQRTRSPEWQLPVSVVPVLYLASFEVQDELGLFSACLSRRSP